MRLAIPRHLSNTDPPSDVSPTHNEEDLWREFRSSKLPQLFNEYIRERNQKKLKDIQNLIQPKAIMEAEPVEDGKYFMAFRHECAYYGCRDHACVLCSQAQERRCARNFCAKYLVGEPLKTSCSSDIVVDVLRTSDGMSVYADELEDLTLQAMLINAEHVKRNRMLDLEDAMNKRVVKSPSGLSILQNTAELSADGLLPLHPIQRKYGVSDISVQGSSEASLSGHKPNFCLLIAAYDGQGKRSPLISPLVSEPFQVTSVRVRSAQKKEILHINDDIKHIIGLGSATQV